MKATEVHYQAAAAGLAAMLPWLFPLSGGPSASVQPWLFSAACTALLALACGAARLPATIAAVAALLAGLGAARGSGLDAAAVMGGLAVAALGAATALRAQALPRVPQAIAAGWLAAGLTSTVIALMQAFGVADVLGPLASASGDFEAYANLRQRNQFGTLCALSLAALLWGFPAQRRWQFGAAALLAAGSAATTSRIALVELLLLGLAAAVWSGPSRAHRLRVWGLSMLAYGAAAMTLPALQELAQVTPAQRIWERVAGAPGCSSRSVLWSNVMHLISQHPFTGWGWGELDYAHYATLYPGERFCDILDNAHNLPLHLAVELGLPVAVGVVAVALWGVWRASPWREASEQRRLAWAVLGLIAAHSLVEYPLWYGPFQLAAGLAVGMLCKPAAARPAGDAAYGLVLSAVLATAVGYASWDYVRVSQIYLQPEDRAARYRDDTLAHVRQSRLFQAQALFAEVTIQPLNRANAQWTLESSLRLLHYSPEPKLIEKVIESATLLGREDLALWHLARYRAAFPEQHAAWARERRKPQGAT